MSCLSSKSLISFKAFLSLVHKAEQEIALSDTSLAGDITVGAAETDGVRFLARAAKALQQDHPGIHLHIVSGDKITVLESLDRGLVDFCLVFGGFDAGKYDSLFVPMQDHVGLLMRRDSPLAKKAVISRKELQGLPLIVSRQMLADGEPLAPNLNIVGTYTLLFNGSLMVEEGLGYALCFDGILNVSGNSELCFRPLEPEVTQTMCIIWKKYQVLTKAAEKFLLQMKAMTK